VAYTKLKKRDLNRFRKVYPYIRREPRFILCSEKEVIMEVGSATFAGETSVVYVFGAPFSTAPTVTALSIDTEMNNAADVNAWVSNVTTTSVTINVSAPLHGSVHFHAIWIAS